jgi:hypothetical protein
LAYTVASGFDDRAKITILDACERCTRSQKLRQRGSQQEGDDPERDQDLDERENFLSVATPRHSQKAGWFHWQERVRAGISSVFVSSVNKTLLQYGRDGTHGILNRRAVRVA